DRTVQDGGSSGRQPNRMSASRKLGELLFDRHLLTKDVLEHVLAREEVTGVPLAKLLVEEQLVREEDLLAAIAERVGMPFVALDDMLLEPKAVDRLDPERARALTAIPVRMEADELVVAIADPLSPALVAELERATGLLVKPALATRASIRRALEFAHGPVPVPARQPGQPVTDDTAEEEDEQVHVNQLLAILLDMGGSDLHLTSGSPPQVRVNGSLRPLEQYPVFKPAELRRMIYGILTEKQRDRLEETLELDASHPLARRGRFRANVFFQRDAIGAVFRAIPSEVQTLEQLGIPSVVAEFADLTRGLVLVTGPTGSGKSTTLASIIDLVNTRRACHIMTVEDPIEFLHSHQRAVVNQREVGADTLSFSSALRHVLRQDPDVILIGEMRDLETISTALTAAETGHLVFATLHTQDAPQTIDRIVDVFPSHQQQQIRVQLASTIQAVVTQQLIPTRDGKGRAAAVEVMVATPAIRNLIREAKNHQIATAMQAGGRYGMQTMDQALADLVRRRTITLEAAVERCADVEDLQRLAGRVA
ncbi:MAG: PilT/PilU family type 4a pilus ATPase, partial [Acidimicrobiia bacterium]